MPISPEHTPQAPQAPSRQSSVSSPPWLYAEAAVRGTRRSRRASTCLAKGSTLDGGLAEADAGGGRGLLPAPRRRSARSSRRSGRRAATSPRPAGRCRGHPGPAWPRPQRPPRRGTPLGRPWGPRPAPVAGDGAGTGSPANGSSSKGVCAWARRTRPPPRPAPCPCRSPWPGVWPSPPCGRCRARRRRPPRGARS